MKRLWGSGGQRSRSHEAKDRFGDLAEASFLTTLGRIAFVISDVILLLFVRTGLLSEQSVDR